MVPSLKGRAAAFGLALLVLATSCSLATEPPRQATRTRVMPHGLTVVPALESPGSPGLFRGQPDGRRAP